MTIRADIEKAAGEEKVSKRAAKYGDGLPQAHCGICAHFEPPRACEIVRGVIAPDMWCEYFERKKAHG